MGEGRQEGLQRGAPGWFVAGVALAIALAVLWLASAFLIPLVFALFLFMLLTALLDGLRNVRVLGRRVPSGLTHALSLLLLFAGIGGLLAMLSNQVELFSAALPHYETRLDALVGEAAGWVGDDIAESIDRALDEINIAASLSGALGSAGTILTAFLLVGLYLAFLLADREAFAAKLPLLFPEQEAYHRFRVLIRSVSLSVRRYLWIKTLTSLMTGAVAYLVMKPVGLDFAETWALLAFFLNFIPSIGSVLGTVLPAILALVQFTSLSPFLIILGGVGLAQIVIGNVIEPALMGRRLNLSPFMIILSLTFWAGLWGVSGAFLSVPITVVMLIVCAQVPAWRPIAILLSRDGRLPLWEDEVGPPDAS